MKAKKIVRVELKNPILRRIRKNLRDVIKLAVKQESSRLHTASRDFRERSREVANPVEKERLEQKESFISRKRAELESSFFKSIIQCKLGGGCISYIEATNHGLNPENSPVNLDMAWVPFHGAWFCTKCCEILIEGDKILKKEKHPDYMRLLKESDFS